MMNDDRLLRLVQLVSVIMTDWSSSSSCPCYLEIKWVCCFLGIHLVVVLHLCWYLLIACTCWCGISIYYFFVFWVCSTLVTGWHRWVVCILKLLYLVCCLIRQNMHNLVATGVYILLSVLNTVYNFCSHWFIMFIVKNFFG